MIDWEGTEFGVRVTDSAGTEIDVGVHDWTSTSVDHELPRPVDTSIDGHAASLEFGPCLVRVTNLRTGATHELGNGTGPIDLPPGRYLVDADVAIKTYVRFDGAATVRKTPDYQRVTVSFPERTPVTIGFRSHTESPTETVTVPPTPSGLATALSHSHAAIKTTGPDRSFPTLRGHPPLVETGAERDVPDSIRTATADTDIELRLPDDFRSLFVTAPLAYYLQASVTVEPGASPQLRAPSAGVARSLPPVPELQHATAALLRRLFFLDCLVRNAGPHETDLHELSVLEELELDPETAYAAPPGERLATYLAQSDAVVERALPDWHLSMYVTPGPERIGSLPYLLDRMSLVYLPSTSELTGQELVDRSLDDFFRGQAVQSSRSDPDGSVASVDVVEPDLWAGRIHGWLADGIPIDVFKASHSAFENRFEYLDQHRDGIRVTVVLNDEEMGGEHAEAARIYRERSADLPIDVTVREHLRSSALAEVFEANNDFVHYIGHCEEDGLRCPDGNLDVGRLAESNTQTFFLNACGSYYEGMKLIEAGSVAGAVTFSKVLNEQAAKVGTTFARLLVNGFSFERSLKLARRRIMMGKDYAVVGDGTHVLTQCENLYPLEVTVEPDGDEYRLTQTVYAASRNGGYYQVYLPGKDQSYLAGTVTSDVVTRETLSDHLELTRSPVIYGGEFYWPEELASRID